MHAAPTAVLLLSIILVMVNHSVAVSIPKRIKNAMTLFTRPKRVPAPSTVSTSGMYDIDAFMDEHCESGRVGTLSGLIGSGQHDLDREGHYLMFMAPFPTECALDVEMSTGQVRRYRQNYDEGDMLKGHFSSLSVEC
ncbi:uncharacterized protein C8R40DRAFT_609585 [Lentinula edodes]|uniref:uncharacterized protein n=1 Tax=Lentinula edodes TaxID=5353 RepID=UPI001E8EE21C|nr:uncharacterized protein C8R40DRAFT_609585 [Lentinula edodes]KAH7871044.1 hypothetical protein C8R40DRAFT_609585 [Lentinula edodes]